MDATAGAAERVMNVGLDFSGLQGLTGNVCKTDVTTKAAPIQREINREKAERDRSLEICREYQENIQKTAMLRAEINNGILHGENIYSLFLKAIDAIGIMTHDKSMYSRTRESLISIYGYGLGEPEPLEVELKEVEERITRMGKMIWENGHDVDENLKIAIKKHKDIAESLRKRIRVAKARKAVEEFNKAKEC